MLRSGEDGSVEVIKGEAEKYPSKLVHRVENLRKHDPRGYKYNDEIPRGETVRVIVDKENLGVMTVSEAREKAIEMKMDLVLVNDKVSPPVCKIFNFEHYLRDQRDQAQIKKRKTKLKMARRKELRLSPRTSGADFERLMQKGITFLENNMELRIFIRFKANQRHMYKEAIEQLDAVVLALKMNGVPQDVNYRKVIRDDQGKLVYQPFAVVFHPIIRSFSTDKEGKK